MKREYYLCLGRSERLPFTLPASWTTLYCPEPEETPTGGVVRDMARKAIRHPAGVSSFAKAIGAAKHIAVIVDDGTRPTPVAEVLDVVLDELAKLGIPRTGITIVVALGTHVPLSPDGLRARLGADVASKYEVVQHDARNSHCVPVAVPGRDWTVGINRTVAEADARISISSVQPHPMAGFGGGPKLIMPGVADFGSIVKHHMTLTIDPRSVYGEIGGNLFHRDCMMVAKAVGLDFTINCLYDMQGQVAGIVAGTLEESFSRAVQASMERFALEFEEKVDVTITSTYPHTHGLQFSKGLSGPGVITKDTGAILLVAPLVTPCPDEFLEVLESIRMKSGGDALAYAKAIMATGRLFAEGKSAEFNMATYAVLNRAPIRTIVVSPLISNEMAARMGFEHAASLDEGLRMLESAYPRATVSVFPAGGLVLPCVKKDR